MIIYNIHIDTLLNALNLMKSKGYEYMDLDISEDVSDTSKYHSSFNLSGNDKKAEKKTNINKPNRQLTIDELLEYEC